MSYFVVGTRWSFTGHIITLMINYYYYNNNWIHKIHWLLWLFLLFDESELKKIKISLYIYFKQIAGLQLREVRNLANGTLDMKELSEKLRPESPDPHEPYTSLVCIENTHNYCGGTVLPIEWIDQVTKIMTCLKQIISLYFGLNYYYFYVLFWWECILYFTKKNNWFGSLIV